jgi:hypothetical protein
MNSHHQSQSVEGHKLLRYLPGGEMANCLANTPNCMIMAFPGKGQAIVFKALNWMA